MRRTSAESRTTPPKRRPLDLAWARVLPLRAALAACAALALAGTAGAQVPRRPPGEAARQRAQGVPPGPDTARTRADSASDTAKVGRGAGLPDRPSRSFATPDSVTAELMKRPGFRVTRYAADSVQFAPPEKQIRLVGNALLEREGSTLEADTVRYAERNCALTAGGGPKMFDRQGVLVGHGMLYDACNHAGIIQRATTAFPEGGATWYLRGNMAMDNEEDRTYAASSTVTSCDLPDPHYHFYAREVKWVSKSLMVARPAILYVADVPILWMPFIFQDMRRGRRSGLIPPQFGLSDIVRNSPSYHRHITNLGYYFVLGDYADAQATMDWFAQSLFTVSGRVRYRWLDRFLAGGLAYTEMHEVGGSSSKRISWSHQQDFSINSHFTANVDYASSSRIISRNAVDPVLAVATIDSRVNYQQRLPWGSISVGGSRTQYLDKPLVNMTLPTVAFTPNPISFGPSVTWTPSFSLSNALQYQQATNKYVFSGLPGDSSQILSNSRQTAITLSTPLRIGRWTWSNSFSANDQVSNAHDSLKLQDPTDPTRTLVRTYNGSFQTDVDWSTGIGLPVLFQGTWNLQPSVNIVNRTGRSFMVRNRYTGGRFVSQGKRLGYNVSVSPTFFGLFGGIGPVARFRHSISPSVSWSYSPASVVPAAFARAVSANDSAGDLHVPPTQTLTFGLTQNLEAKLRPPPRPPGDTTRVAVDSAGAEPQGPKIRILSIQTSGMAYDIEQAKQKGRTGWLTPSITNTFASDLLRGFSLSTTHDLWLGTVGSDTAKFRPFLSSVSARFALGPSFLQFLGSLFGIGGPSPPAPARKDTAQRAGADTLALPVLPGTNAFQRGPFPTQNTALDRMTPRGTTPQFSATFAFDLARTRPVPGVVTPPTRSTISGGISFSPTRHWNVSWQTLYDVTAGKFGSHVLRLDRDLHDWRATFSFVQSPNGNVVFNFNITLIDQPEIKFDYDQRNVPTGP